MNKNKDKIDSFHEVFKTEWFSIEATSDKFSSDKPYYRLSCNDSAEILAVTAEHKIILVRQFRPALEIYMLEFPSGYINEKESSKDAVERELREETGFVCNSIAFMGCFRIAPSRINNALYLFFGRDAKPVGLKSKRKDLEITLVTEDEFKRLIAKGEFTEVAGLAIYSLAKLKGFL